MHPARRPGIRPRHGGRRHDAPPLQSRGGRPGEGPGDGHAGHSGGGRQYELLPHRSGDQQAGAGPDLGRPLGRHGGLQRRRARERHLHDRLLSAVHGRLPAGGAASGRGAGRGRRDQRQPPALAYGAVSRRLPRHRQEHHAHRRADRQRRSELLRGGQLDQQGVRGPPPHRQRRQLRGGRRAGELRRALRARDDRPGRQAAVRNRRQRRSESGERASGEGVRGLRPGDGLHRRPGEPGGSQLLRCLHGPEVRHAARQHRCERQLQRGRAAADLQRQFHPAGRRPAGHGACPQRRDHGEPERVQRRPPQRLRRLRLRPRHIRSDPSPSPASSATHRVRSCRRWT